MKIVSGSKKSYVIRAPKNLSIVRPTSGLVKESLFNILSNYFIFNEIKVLDLYAGIGNISYEFGSRGCNEIDSVDINSKKEKKAHKERADSCAVPAASIIAENTLSFVIADAILDKFGGDSINQLKKHYHLTAKF